MKEKKSITSAVKTEAIELIKTIGTSMVIAFVTVNFLIRPIRVEGSSMYPTLESDALGIANVLSVRMHDLNRFDIAIIYIEEEQKYLVKRIIGLPGETVAYRSGTLYINGEAVEENFLDTEYRSSYSGVFMADVDEITLGENEYYCLGDNRPNSKDSRFYGPFDRSQIRCKGAVILYPFADFGVKSW